MTTLSLGYKASNEQFGPTDLLALTQHAESRGFAVAGVSDHLQPWRHNGGHAPAVLSWLGAAAATTSSIRLGTSVLTPTMRYHPAIVAQAFATLACLAPGRIFLGVGTGEAMNETPITGGVFPGRKERRMKMAEAIKVIKQLWAEERVDGHAVIAHLGEQGHGRIQDGLAAPWVPRATAHRGRSGGRSGHTHLYDTVS